MEHKPGMADQMLREMAPLLAEDGIDLDQPSTFDMDSLNAALGRAVERSNMERFTPVKEARTYALTVLRLASEAISEGHDEIAHVVIDGLEPEPEKPGEATIAQVIGVGLGFLETWHGDPKLKAALAAVRVPRWNKHARSAATDIIALARKGRAFASLGTLHQRHNGFVILEGTILAVTGTLQAWAAHENQTVGELGLTVLSEP